MLRFTVILLVVALIVVLGAPRLYEHISGVGVLKHRRNRAHIKQEPGQRPVASARLIGLDPKQSTYSKPLPLYSVEGIYALLGVGANDFVDWQKAHGFGTFGRSDAGILFVADFPIFSKIAWMGIDSIDLTPTEVPTLIEECTIARTRSTDAVVSAELEALIVMAGDAIAMNAKVRFGSP